MKDYIPTIGLEIHAELKTLSKMFCGCANDSDEKAPNVNVCPICMGHPGTLPVPNKEAVKHVLKVGLAAGGEIADFTEFDRKNYFYPDIPKGYQISQYKFPLIKGGKIRGVKLTRIHLEEDTGTLIHTDENQRISADNNQRKSVSLVNFNRSSLPLMELVTEPVIHSAEEAAAFAKELQLILRYLGASDANMEKGQMRVEANISVAKINADNKTTDSRGLLYEDLTYKIRGIVFDVYNNLGFVHKESIYQNALEEGLKKNNILYEREKNIDVIYEDKKVGTYRPDFIVDGKIIIETKALPFIGEIERKQILHYLRGSDYKLALLVNFGSDKLKIDRLVFDSIRDKDTDESSTLIRENLSGNQRKSPLGTKVEVKNLNSFKSVERAIAYEIERHVGLLESGAAIAQETRGFDENTGKTFSQRTKEDSHDYRYFPEPDIPKLFLSQIPEFAPDVLKKEMPELPEEKRKRYAREYGIKPEDIEFFVGNIALAKFFENAIENFCNDKVCVSLASNYIVSDLAGLMKSQGTEIPGHLYPSSFGKLVLMIKDGKLSSRGAKDTLAILFKDGGEPEKIAEEKGWILKNDPEALKKVLKKIVADNPAIIADYKAGKDVVLNSLVGKAMKGTGGSYSPQVIKETLISLV